MSALDAAVDQLATAVADAVADRLADRLSTTASEASTPWLSAEQAATYLGDAPLSRVYDLVQTGKLAAHRDGRRLVLHRDDLDGYLRGGV